MVSSISKQLAGVVAGSLLALSAAQAETITFDVAQAAYVPTPGVTQEVTDQFASLGVLFRDRSSVGHGATLGRCGPGDGPVALFGFGADFPGCGDTTPDLDILFVDPTNSANAGFTTSFSIFNYDGLVKATAYDLNGIELGSTQTYAGELSFSGIGNISRVNLLSLDQDPTTMDTLTFGTVTAAVPEPESIALLVAGLLMVGVARKRAAKAQA